MFNKRRPLIFIFILNAIMPFITVQSYDQFSSYDQSQNCVSSCVNGDCTYSCSSGNPNGGVCTQCVNDVCTITNCKGVIIRQLTPEESRQMIKENQERIAETNRRIQLENQRLQNQLNSNFQQFQNQFQQNMRQFQQQLQQQFGGNFPFRTRY